MVNSKLYKSVLIWGVIFICVVLMSLLIVFIDKFSVPSTNISDGIVAIVSAFVGVVITVAVTGVLLNTQSETEYLREKNVKQFEKKQETYHDFLEQLGNIITDLTKRSLAGDVAQSYENIASLENLIFQFGYLRIHMPDDTFIKVMAYTSEIFDVYRKQKFRANYNKDIVEQKKSRSDQVNQGLYKLTQVIAKKLFAIAAILNSDMYGEKANDKINPQIENITIQLLKNCGLGVKPIE
ncbi:MAG: hypothetical protein IKY37_08090 [Bacteroidaceae bacterium]|nr:hypothetical protein [Bacteroidaceae bacterium]